MLSLLVEKQFNQVMCPPGRGLRLLCLLLDHKESPAAARLPTTSLPMRAGARSPSCVAIRDPYPDGNRLFRPILESTFGCLLQYPCDSLPDLLYLRGWQAQFLYCLGDPLH